MESVHTIDRTNDRIAEIMLGYLEALRMVKFANKKHPSLFHGYKDKEIDYFSKELKNIEIGKRLGHLVNCMKNISNKPLP